MQMANGQVQEYVASGTNTNGRIVLAYVKAGASGIAIYPQNCKTKCKINMKTLKITKCATSCVKRAFTAAELKAIQNGLIGIAYNQLEARFVDFQNNVNNRLYLFYLNSDLERQAQALSTVSSRVKKAGNLKLIPFTGYN